MAVCLCGQQYHSPCHCKTTNHTHKLTVQLDHTHSWTEDSIYNFFIAHFVTAQDKLCLLVMSLPAHHLCLEPVVRAIEVSSVDNSHVASYTYVGSSSLHA